MIEVIATPVLATREPMRNDCAVQPSYPQEIQVVKADNGFMARGYDNKGSFSFVFITKKALLDFINKNM